MIDEVALRAQRLAAARKLLDKFKLHDWTITFADLSKVPTRTLVGSSFGAEGICHFASKQILVDPSVVPHRNKFFDIVRHEAAHALLQRPGHDDAWLRIAKRIGCSKKSLAVYRLIARVDEFKKQVSQ